MADVINLRSARKRARREQDAQRAGANRLEYGLPKHVRTLDTEKRAKAKRDLDRHRIDRGDDR